MRRKVQLVVVPDEPVVEQLVDQVERLVAFGVLGPGDELPGLHALADELVLSRATVQRVYDVLEQRGVTEPRAGSGTYVRDTADTRSTVVRKWLGYVLTLARNLGLSREEFDNAMRIETERYYEPRRKRSL